jgi:Ca-activated chloride channel family protein
MLTPEVAKTSDKREIDNLQQIQGDTLDNLKYKPNNIVFLIDASGSMKDENKLPLLKKAIIRLTEPLRSSDFISIIAYADDVEILISNKAGNKKTALLEAVNSLKADGITAGAAGLNKAYELILQNYIVGGNNQILLATDGVFRLSATQRKSIEMQAKSIEKPVALSIVALGNDDAAIQMLTTLSHKGNGNLIHLNDASKDKIDLILNEIVSRSLR